MQQHFCVRIREKLMVCFQERSDFQGKHITELKLFMRFVSHTRKRNFYDLCSGNASFQLFKVPRMSRKQIFLMKSRVVVFFVLDISSFVYHFYCISFILSEKKTPFRKTVLYTLYSIQNIKKNLFFYLSCLLRVLYEF